MRASLYSRTMTQAYGVADPEDFASKSGIELLRAMIAGDIPAPTISRALNFRLVEIEPGRAVFECAIDANVLNPLGSVHGGIALTLIDSAAGCALHSELGPGVGYSSIETKVNFTRPIGAGAGTIRAEGTVLSRGRQIATAEARLVSADGKLLAHGTSTLMILGQR